MPSSHPRPVSCQWFFRLAAVLDCSLTSLRYHARKEGIAVSASGTASGTVTRREEDGRFAFVEIEACFDVHLEPAPTEV